MRGDGGGGSGRCMRDARRHQKALGPEVALSRYVTGGPHAVLRSIAYIYALRWRVEEVSVPAALQHAGGKGGFKYRCCQCI